MTGFGGGWPALVLSLGACGGVAASALEVGDTPRPAIFDQTGRVDPFSIPPLPTPVPLEVPRTSARAKATPVTATFVDSQGRSLMYRYVLPDAANPVLPQPVMIYFHGNNTATQQQILDGFFPGVAFSAGQRGLAAVVVASPQTRAPPQEGVRQWYDEDELTIQEFLSTRLPTHFAVDTSRIYFMGGSQGTCFLNEFMHSFGEAYRGGFFGGCGCYNTLDATWTPPPAFVDGMKVYIASTRDDFLLEPSWNGYGLYKYTVGFDTRGDLEAAGAHCSAHWSQLETALDWFTGRSVLPEEPFAPHWSRVSATGEIASLALTDDGDLWRTRFDMPMNRTTLQRSTDHGASWGQVQQFNGELRKLTANGMALFAIDDAGFLRRSNDAGTNIQLVASDSYYRDVFVDGAGALYFLNGSGAVVSGGSDGSVRSVLAAGPKIFLNTDGVAGLSAPRVIAADQLYYPATMYSGSVALGGLAPAAPTALGTAVAAAWDGGALYALVRDGGIGRFRIYRSSDTGAIWNELVLPAAFAQYYFYGARLSALAHDTVLTRGGYGSSWMSPDAGVNWIRLPGLSTAYEGEVVASGDDVYFTDGEGVFRLIRSELGPDEVFANGFESNPFSEK